MITTKRNGNGISESYARSNTAVGILERETPADFSEYKNPDARTEENLSEAKDRMQRNLDKLLNYDRYQAEMVEAVAVDVPVSMPVEVAQVTSNSDEDIRPTSTTMQFGDGDLDQMYKEMNVKDENKESYRLNAKGKLAVVLYSLAVAVIMALIVLNTGVLAKLNKGNELRQAELNDLVSYRASQQADIDSISNNDYVIDVAQNELGMVKGN